MKICPICSSEIGIFDFGAKKFNYNEKICKECLNKIPSVMHTNLQYLTPDDYNNIISYVDNIKNSISDFSVTNSYGDLHLDSNKGLFAICKKSKFKNGKLDPNELNIFNCLDLENIELNFIKDKNRKIQNGNVYGNVELIFGIKSLDINVKHIVKKNEKTEIIQIENQYGYDEPYELKIFKSEFQRMIEKTVNKYNENVKRNNEIFENLNKEMERQQKIYEEMKRESERLEKEKNNLQSELEKAKTLFMVSDGYSVEEIKKIRNRLIKSFHPDGNDVGDEYAKKINNAYDVLIKNKKGV